MMRKTLLAAAVVAALSTVAFAQGYGPGAGNCAYGQAGAGCGGYGPGAGGAGPGRGMRGGSPLWTPEEMAAHRNAMHSLKSVDECRAYVEQHRAAKEARAKELGVTPGPGPRADMCERMAARGFFQ